MAPLLKKIFGHNWVLFLLMVALLGFGVYAIYSATWMREDQYLLLSWRKQTNWIMLGLVVYFVTSLLDYRWVRWGALPIYAAGLAALVLCAIKGSTVYGAKSWLKIGPVSFQPSQLAILSGIMVLAIFLAHFKKLPAVVRIAACGAIIAGPWLLILKQPDLGSAIVWIPVFMIMIFVGGIPKRYLIVMLLLGAIMLPITYNFALKPYQQARVTTFLHPERDPLGAGWTINQSLTAIGSGGWAGKGFKAPNTLNELGFLPSTIVHNDFIFAVIGEQHGFVGGAALIGVFACLLLTMLLIAYNARDSLGLLLASGIIALIFAHVYMNIGMTISITPITGVPLPLVSYGGSFVLVIMFSLGLLQSIWIHRHSIK